MTKSSTSRADEPVAAPWWWPSVELDLAPQIDTLASASTLTRDLATRRVWAMLGLMTDRSFSTDSLRRTFPEVDLAGVQPWKIRGRYVEAIRNGPEADVARTALRLLGAAVGQGGLPRPPSWPARKPQSKWQEVFSRSTRGRHVFFIRGTHQSHMGMDALSKMRTHREFQSIGDVCRRYDLVRRVFSTGSPANASTYESYAAFLDGGLQSRGGDYLVGLHGAWVHGHEALRFLCLALGLTPPPWPKEAGLPPTHEEILRHLLLQLALDLSSLQRRVDEYAGQ